MDKSERREQQAHKARYGPKLTNPGLRIVQRELAAKARDLVACPVCTPIVNPACRDCGGTKLVSVEDARLINIALRRS